MIITEKVLFRGKWISVGELSKNSTKKVKVRCPECNKIRSVMYRSICNAGHHICLPCMRLIKQGKRLKLGAKYGRLTVIENRLSKSLVMCECGNEKVVNNDNLKSGHTKSCGCLRVENMIRIGVYPSKENHWNWRGGVSDERGIAMSSKDYKQWRENVFQRDNYTCQKCGQVGYELQAHHIFNFAKYPNLRTTLENGITFCKSCHRKYHNLNGNITNKEQLDNFM